MPTKWKDFLASLGGVPQSISWDHRLVNTTTHLIANRLTEDIRAIAAAKGSGPREQRIIDTALQIRKIPVILTWLCLNQFNRKPSTRGFSRKCSDQLTIPAVSKQFARRNRILAALPDAEFVRLLPHLESVHLEKGEIVYLTGDEIQHAYFLDSGLLSFLSTTETGSTIEVAMVGNEGIVGLPVILRNPITPYEVIVRFASEAFKLKAEALLEEFNRGETLHEWILRYLNVLMVQTAQSSICNRFHTFEQTLSRWLLTVHDRVNSDSLNLTHETISNALGVPRTAVTMAAGSLQRAGIIRYSRGKISILDHGRLEANSCECYRIITNELRNF